MFILSGINKLNIKSPITEKIGSFNHRVLASHAHEFWLLGASGLHMNILIY